MFIRGQIEREEDPFRDEVGVGSSPQSDSAMLGAAAPVSPYVVGLVAFVLSSHHDLSPIFTDGYAVEKTVVTWSRHHDRADGEELSLEADPLIVMQAQDGEVPMVAIVMLIVRMSGLTDVGGVGACSLGTHGMRRSSMPIGDNA